MAPLIQRDDLLRKLVRAQGNGMVKIITGIRRSVNDACAKILITAEREPRHYDEHGILCLPLIDFLLNPAALPL